MNLSDIAILNIKGSHYGCIVSGISKIEIVTFGNTDIEKNKVYYHEILIVLRDVDTEKVLVSKKISSSEKKL